MRIYPNKIESFLRDPGPDVSAVLVFGPDRGLVRERLAQLLKSTAGDPEDPFRLARLAASRVIEDPRCLYDEAAALPLTGGRRVVVIDETGDELADTFSDFLTDAVVDSLVLVGSGDLPPRSRLRQLFERARRAAALPCYPDDERSLRRLIGQYLGDAGVTADSQAVAYLAGNLGGDRELVRRELEKLALYIGPGGRASAADAAACIEDSALMRQEEVAFAAADGNDIALDRALLRAWAEGSAPVAVVRTVQRHLHRLHLVAGQCRAGDSLDGAIKSLRPPVFWKNEKRFRNQVTRWSESRLATALSRLTEAEIRAKSSALPDQACCSRALMHVSALARRREH